MISFVGARTINLAAIFAAVGQWAEVRSRNARRDYWPNERMMQTAMKKILKAEGNGQRERSLGGKGGSVRDPGALQDGRIDSKCLCQVSAQAGSYL